MPVGWTPGQLPSTKAANATSPQTVPGNIFALAIFETFPNKEEYVSAQTGISCLLLPRNRQHNQHPSNFFLKGSECCK